MTHGHDETAPGEEHEDHQAVLAILEHRALPWPQCPGLRVPCSNTP